MTLRCYCAVLFLLTLESFWFIRTRIVYMYKPCTKKILILWYLTLFCKSIISKICYLILSVWWNRDNNRLSVQGWTLKRLTKACLQHSKCLIVHFIAGARHSLDFDYVSVSVYAFNNKVILLRKTPLWPFLVFGKKPWNFCAMLLTTSKHWTQVIERWVLKINTMFYDE